MQTPFNPLSPFESSYPSVLFNFQHEEEIKKLSNEISESRKQKEALLSQNIELQATITQQSERIRQVLDMCYVQQKEGTTKLRNYVGNTARNFRGGGK